MTREVLHGFPDDDFFDAEIRVQDSLAGFHGPGEKLPPRPDYGRPAVAARQKLAIQVVRRQRLPHLGTDGSHCIDYESLSLVGKRSAGHLDDAAHVRAMIEV